MKKYYCYFIFIAFLFTEIVKAKNNYTRFESAFSTSFLVESKKPHNLVYSKSNDSLSLISTYINTADLNKNKGLYAIAFEDLWKAMLLAEEINDITNLVTIHDEIGGLYGIYGKEEHAIKHKQLALQYIKKSLINNKDKNNRLAKAYYSLAVQYRKAKNYDKSLIYLDSCLYSGKQENHENNPFVLAEKGTIFLIKNQPTKAEAYLLKATKLLEEGNKHYLVIVYSFLGDLYTKEEKVDKALHFYELSLKKMDEFNSHTDIKAAIFQKIAALYKQKNDLLKAYSYIENSTKISDSLFSIKSKNNLQLFEIKNNYQESALKKDIKINQQNLLIEKKKRIQSQLLVTIGFILFGTIILVFVFYHYSKIRKLKAEKLHTDLKITYEKEKLNAVLETKNKELTVSTLQLIEKEKNVERLLEVLKNDSPNTYKKLQKDITRGNKDLWKSFNLRFTEVNNDFYNRLSEKHPTLTPTEQKHCALIKLKFDSKEMASILNISVSSVHISRHRIRKKIELLRDDDLSNYIAGI